MARSHKVEYNISVMDYIVLGIGFLLSLVIVLLTMPQYIKLLRSLNYNQTVSEYALDEYKDKGKIPIMGGLLFVLVPIIVTFIIDPLVFYDLKTIMVIVSYVLFCLIGFLDDFLIIRRHDNEGLSPKLKMLMQIVFAALIYFIFRDIFDHDLDIHLFDVAIPLGAFYGLFLVFMYTAEANAVNFTDVIDGLSSCLIIIALIPYLIFSFIQNEFHLAVFIVSCIGALLGYLNYNFAPAKVFMGDSGSLAIGALFTAIAVVLGRELSLLVIGGIFLIEMLCVCLQQFSVRLFHKRILPYTPIHYAFTLKMGMKEKKVVIMFYIVASIFSVVGLIMGVI